MGGWAKVCVPKMGLSFLPLYSKFHFPLEEMVSGFVWVGGSSWVGGSARSHPPMDAVKPLHESSLMSTSGDGEGCRARGTYSTTIQPFSHGLVQGSVDLCFESFSQNVWSCSMDSLLHG